LNVYNINGVDVVELKPVSDDKESLCVCPSCGREKLYINKESFLFDCKVCGIHGKANGDGLATTSKQHHIPAKRNPIPASLIHLYIQRLVDSLQINEYVRSYFLQKKLPIELAEEFKVGYSIRIPKYDNTEIATALGLINKNGNNRFYKRIVFPVMNGGIYVYVVSRAVGLRSDAKYLDMTSPHGKPIFNEDVLPSIDEVFVCEGIPDTLSMIYHGNKNAIGILGAGTFNESYIDKLKGKNVILAYDADIAGKINARNIGEMLMSRGINVRSVDLPDGYDIADYFAAGHRELKIVDIKDIEPGERKLIFDRNEENLIVYKYGRMELRISDIDLRRGSLRVVIQIFMVDKIIASSNVDLNSQRARGMFAKEICNASNNFVQLTEAKEFLLNIANSINERIKDEREKEPKITSYVMSDKEREEAVKFLQSQNLMHCIKNALDRQEIVGEDTNKLLVYLICTSRIMRKPISCVIKGLSSSGKTYMMQKVLTLIPPEGKKMVQSLSAKSLFYSGEQDLKHKIIIIGEMKGSEQAQYSIREAQDGIGDGDLIVITVEKDPETNRMETTERRVQGPVGFMTSTTDVSINEENETRNFSLYVKVDSEKVRETSSVLVNHYTFQSNTLSDEETLLFHNAQRCLEPSLKVKIPYVKYILSKFPDFPIRVMRDRARFCVLIETIAILHQFQRKIFEDKPTGERWIEASVCDYYIAQKLLREILVETIYEIPPKSKEIYTAAIEIRNEFVTEKQGSEILDEAALKDMFQTTYKKIGEKIKMKSNDVRRWSKPLFDGGYFEYADMGERDEKRKGGRGKETHLKPVDKEFCGSFLPSPEDVLSYLGYQDESIYDPITGEVKTISGIKDVDI
jgi:hypothetical protein